MITTGLTLPTSLPILRWKGKGNEGSALFCRVDDTEMVTNDDTQGITQFPPFSISNTAAEDLPRHSFRRHRAAGPCVREPDTPDG